MPTPVAGASNIILLPDTFSYEQGAMVEPVSVAVHAVRRAGEMQGKNVAVLGAGSIGNLVAQVARAGGANVLITDVSDFRLDIARQCGLENTCNPSKESFKYAVLRSFGKTSYRVGFECVGIEATMTDAIETIAKGGTIVVVGVFGEKPRVDMGLVQNNELNLVGTLMYKKEDYERAVELIGGRSGDNSADCPAIIPWMITWMPISSSTMRATGLDFNLPRTS